MSGPEKRTVELSIEDARVVIDSLRSQRHSWLLSAQQSNGDFVARRMEQRATICGQIAKRLERTWPECKR